MKKHLFYTFLGIFIATAIVTLLGVTEVITIKDKYLMPLLTALIIESIGAVIGLYKVTDFFNDTTKEIHKGEKDNSLKHEKTEAPLLGKKLPMKKEKSSLSIDDILILAESDNISLEDYHKILIGLDHRFREKQKFIKKMTGKFITWKVKVTDVSAMGEDSFYIGVSSSLDPNLYFGASANFRKEHETDVFALQKGDIIEIQGTLDTSVSNNPRIAGESFKLIKTS